MSAQMTRLLPFLFALALASTACGSSDGAAAPGSADVAEDGSASDGGSTDAGAICCPIAAEPTCDCAATGGSVNQQGGCVSVCDAAPVGWTKTVDENGCPMWAPGNGYCFVADAGVDAGSAEDAGSPSDADQTDIGANDTVVWDGGDIVAGVSCGAGSVVFPSFDKTCQTKDECTVVEHQINCCGTRVAWGIAKGANAAFNAAEAVCQQQYPKCKCAAQATVADDGNTTIDGGKFAADCVQGHCWSYVSK